MTNKERVEAYTSKLDELQNLLKTKISTVDTKPVELVFPEEMDFTSSSTVYTFQVNPDIVLVSLHTIDTGLWRYRVSDNTWKKLYDKGSSWRLFQSIGKDCLISGYPSSSNQSVGLLLYDVDKDEIIQLTTTGYRHESFMQFGDNWLVYGPGVKKPISYNTITKTAIEAQPTKISSSGYSVAITIEHKVLLSLGLAYDTGIICYDTLNNTFTEIYTKGSTWRYFAKLNDIEYLLSSSYSGLESNKDLLVYNINTDNVYVTTTMNKYVGYNLKYIKDNLVFLTYYSSYDGFYIYDHNSKTITQYYAEYRFNPSITYYDSKMFVSSYDEETPCYVYYDTLTKETKIVSDILHWIVYQTETPNGLLLGSGSHDGVYFYNKETQEVETLTTAGYASKVIGECNGVYFISSGTNTTSALTAYNSNTHTFKTLYSTKYYWDMVIPVGNTCLIGGAYDMTSSLPPLLLFNTDTFSTQSLVSSFIFDTVVQDGDNFIVSHKNKQKQPISYKVNLTDKKAIIYSRSIQRG